MSEPRLDDWLAAVGFDADDAALGALDADDPWGALDVPVATLSDDQRAFLTGDLVADDAPVDDVLLAEADGDIIEFPDEPDSF